MTTMVASEPQNAAKSTIRRQGFHLKDKVEIMDLNALTFNGANVWSFPSADVCILMKCADPD